ncbi:MAG: hypothetical protein IJN03_01900 [Bacilli bacterium]|nr:hypothetical protein [Bacilli bacterium]
MWQATVHIICIAMKCIGLPLPINFYDGDGDASAWSVGNDGDVSNYSVNYDFPGARPVINLKADVQFEGNGQIGSEYTIVVK